MGVWAQLSHNDPFIPKLLNCIQLINVLRSDGLIPPLRNTVFAKEISLPYYDCVLHLIPLLPRIAMAKEETDLRLAEPEEIHAQVGFDAVHGPGEGDAPQEQHSQDHIGHGGRDPHHLHRPSRVM